MAAPPTPFPRCAGCGGWGRDLVSARTRRCAACERACISADVVRRAYGPEPAPTDEQRGAWRTRHLEHLSRPTAWRTALGEPRDEVVLALAPPLTIGACTELAAPHGFVAAPIERTACTCPPRVVMGMQLPRVLCMCPTETWVSYVRAAKSPATGAV